MGKLRRIALVLTAGLLVIGSWYNATVGVYITADGSRMKLVLAKYLGGDCGSAAIEEQIATAGTTDCLTPVGTLTTPDLIPMVVGALLLVMAFRKGLKGGSATEVRRGRSGRIRFALGLSLIGLVISDIAGLLSDDGSMLVWSEILILPLPNAFFLGALVIVGLKLVASGHKMISRSNASLKGNVVDGISDVELMQQETLFKQPMIDVFGGKDSTKAIENFRTVGEMRRSMKLDQYDDEFERGLIGDDLGSSMGRTCHYCNGVGCDQCEGTGHL